MFKDRRPIRSLLTRKRFSKPRTRSVDDPYTTSEISGAFEQTALALDSIYDILEQNLGIDPKDEDMIYIKVAIDEIQKII